MTVLAHVASGHWYEVVLYLAPVAAVAIALWWSGRHADDDADHPDVP